MYIQIRTYIFTYMHHMHLGHMRTYLYTHIICALVHSSVGAHTSTASAITVL